MSEINRVAAAFLREIERGETQYKEEKTDVETPVGFTGLVALRCVVTRKFFYGFKPSGRPVFTHDLRLAKAFESHHNSLVEHVERLELIGQEIALHPTVWVEGKHQSE